MRPRRAGWLAPVWLASAVACQSIPDREIPSNPIAFTYRTPEEARRRADAWNDEQKKEIGAARDARIRAAADEGLPPNPELRSSTEQLSDYFSKLLGRTAPTEEKRAGRLALLDPATGKVTVIEAARRGSIPLEWSADRTHLLFAQPGDRDFQIYEYDHERGTVRPITHGPPAHTQACYASEGRIVVIAFDANAKPPLSRVEVSRPGGGGPFEPLTDWGMQESPSCAPDGRSVVWDLQNAEGRYELQLRVLVAGTQTLALAPGRQPRFSADGAWIVYSAPVGRDWRIWRVRPDGSGRAPIGGGERNEAGPTMSPDGRFVAYVSTEVPPRMNLYLRRFDGSGDRILFADGDGENPVW